ncbi:hypothetical protein AAGS61_02945 [Lysinibacillus sp. KU-BSD001]|uniref:hypothetical protein n=1 Tax=Lysinibacillus sp. KU-BSD001 TaxID=3141328 RepID=UPI0036E3BE39
MNIAYQCMNDSFHVFKGKNLDGVSCPICEAPVLLKTFDDQKDNALPEYKELKKQYRKKFIQSECLKCKHVQRNECNNKAIEVFVCVKCNGASIDTWVKNIKYPSNPKLKSTIAIDLGLDDKTKLKLRAIAQHTEALADELDAIDNAWKCECGSIHYEDSILKECFSEEVTSHKRECQECNKVISMLNELEGTE